MLTRREPVLRTARLRIRPLVRGDAAALESAGADGERAGAWAAPPSRVAAAVDAAVRDAEAGHAFEWAVEYLGEVVGRVGIERPAWLGYLFARRAWGKGLALEALEAVARKTAALGVPTLQADLDPANERTRRLLAQVGFVETARLAGTWPAAAGWRDSALLEAPPTPADAPVALREVHGPADIAVIRGLMRDYAAWVGHDLSFQHFDEELAHLPGAYAPPDGVLIAAWRGGTPLGMVALRARSDTRAEMKRLYVRPEARGAGAGRLLVARVLDEARARGYAEMVLDTLPIMGDAQRLYAQAGFGDIPAYYESPIQGTRFLGRPL